MEQGPCGSCGNCWVSGKPGRAALPKENKEVLAGREGGPLAPRAEGSTHSTSRSHSNRRHFSFDKESRMAKRTRRWMARTAGVATLLCWGSALPAPAAPTPAQILSFTPRQAGVDCTTPTAEQQKDCKVELVKTGKGSGWLLSDKSGTLRRFADTNGDNKIGTWSFYKNGAQVCGEVDRNANGKPDQYRWLNGGGSKWGVDQDEDGHIDGWRAISAEEVSQEALLAVSTRDYSRLQALLLTEAEIKALDLSAAEAQRVRASLREAQAKFTELLSKLKGIEKASWIHLETAAPQGRPAEDGSTRL